MIKPAPPLTAIPLLSQARLAGTRIFLVFALLFLVGFCTLGATERRPLTGLVIDKRGNPLPGAAVELEDRATLSIMSYITGTDGRYHFNGLLDDRDYTLKAKYKSYWSNGKILSKFNSSKNPHVDLIVPID
jgi:hypothetical protein